MGVRSGNFRKRLRMVALVLFMVSQILGVGFTCCIPVKRIGVIFSRWTLRRGVMYAPPQIIPWLIMVANVARALFARVLAWVSPVSLVSMLGRENPSDTSKGVGFLGFKRVEGRRFFPTRLGIAEGRDLCE